MTGLAEKDRRAITLGATVIVTAFVLLRGLPVVAAQLGAARDAAAVDRHALAQAHALVNAMPDMRDSLMARRQRLSRALAAALPPMDAAAAASRLGAIVSAAARDVGVSVSAVRLRPDSTATRLGRPRIAIDARGDVSGLMQLLLLIEGGSSLLSVKELVVTQPDPVGTAQAEELAMVMVIEGLARVDTTAAGATR